ncbi:MAG: ABC-2 family transporter protein [Chloroflexota bacterium]
MNRSFMLYRHFIAIHLRSQMQYRVSFLFNLAASFVAFVLAFASLALILQRFKTVGGWTWAEVVFAYSLGQIAFGITEILFEGFTPDNFRQRIRLGQLDQLLLRPVSPMLQILGSELHFLAATRSIQGLVILGITINLLQLEWTWNQWLYLPLVLLGGVGFFSSLFIIGATVNIWTVEATQTIQILTSGSLRMIAYPMHIYPNWMRRFFTYIVPAIFLNYYPSLYFLEKPDPFHMPSFAPLLTPIVGLGMFIGALFFWQFGLKHYQSTGS